VLLDALIVVSILVLLIAGTVGLAMLIEHAARAKLVRKVAAVPTDVKAEAAKLEGEAKKLHL